MCWFSGMRDESKQMQCLQLLIQLLPMENFHLLQHLLCLLTKVTKQPQTKMTAENLAILFTPNLIVPRKVRRTEGWMRGFCLDVSVGCVSHRVQKQDIYLHMPRRDHGQVLHSQLPVALRHETLTQT